MSQRFTGCPAFCFYQILERHWQGLEAAGGKYSYPLLKLFLLLHVSQV